MTTAVRPEAGPVDQLIREIEETGEEIEYVKRPVITDRLIPSFRKPTYDARGVRIMKVRLKMPWLYKKQREAIFSPKQITVTFASTKSGKTMTCEVWLCSKAIVEGGPGKVYWWVAPSYSQAKIAFREIQTMLRKAPRGFVKADKSVMTLTFFNGAIMEFKTSENPDMLYGFKTHGVVVDEATRMKEAAWDAIKSTTTTTMAQIRIIGNVKGRNNWVFKLYQRALNQRQAFARGEITEAKYYIHCAIITALDAVRAGVMPLLSLQQSMQDYSDIVFKELFLCVPSDDAGNPFTLAAINRATKRWELDSLRDPASGLAMEESRDSWGMVLRTAATPWVWGWDFAVKHDYTVGIALDKKGRVCRFVRFNKCSWDLLEKRVLQETGTTPALVDETAQSGLMERLQGNGKRPWIQGYNFGGGTKKQDLMETLAIELQGDRLTFPPVGVCEASEIAKEMLVFGYEYNNRTARVTYSAPQGLHDDCVCALALASMHMAHAKAVTVTTGTDKGYKPLKRS